MPSTPCMPATAAPPHSQWSLSGQVMGSADSVRQCLEAVVWLDAACARARFGRWLLCVPPERAEWGGIPGRAVAKARKTGQKQARGAVAALAGQALQQE